jgi:hypothetical protein
LDVPTRSSRGFNPAAWASVVVGLAALAVWPAAIAADRYSDRVGLVHALIAAIPVSLFLAFLSILLARRARKRIQVTIGRVGGVRTARLGRAVAITAVCATITGALAVGFFGLLQLFAR